MPAKADLRYIKNTYWLFSLKIADYLTAGCEVTILIADLHAYLDNMKSSLELINHRAEYYIKMIQLMLISMDINIDQLKFVKGSSFQLTSSYTMDMYKVNSFTSIKTAQHAGAEVVKQSDNPMINGLLYPTLQALDEEYLGVDASTGGLDQRKIMMHARSILPAKGVSLHKLGYKKRHEFLTKMVSGLRFTKKEVGLKNSLDKDKLLNIINANDDNLLEQLQSVINTYQKEPTIDKMSASNHDTKIDLLGKPLLADTKKQLAVKINKCYCLSGDIIDNCLIEILEQIIFPILNYKNQNFMINRKEKFNKPLIYKTIEEVKYDFTMMENNDYKLHPGDLKLGMIDNLDFIIKPIRDAFQNKELQQLLKLAYPV